MLSTHRDMDIWPAIVINTDFNSSAEQCPVVLVKHVIMHAC